jgi:5-methylcytosine-specific restriction endonuclease McrA
MDKSMMSTGNDTLVLNSDGLPLSMIPVSTINWKDAITSTYLDQIDVLHTYEDWVVRSAYQEFHVPAVVIMRSWVRVGRSVKYSRQNVYLRDRLTCQYCNVTFHKDDLTLDHYVPKVDGGKSEWKNIVTSCKPCNHTKGHSRVGWQPLNQPRKPSYGEMVNILRESPITIRHPSWNFYLGWPEELIKIQR